MRGQPILFTTICWVLFACNVPASVFYVDVNSTNPVLPYTSWATAATNIQDALNFAGMGNVVLVTNGVYQYGSANGFRALIPPNTRLQSVNGPAVTTIVGYQVPGATNGSSAISCVALPDGAVLSGFTLTNGATHLSSNGGGVNCQSTNGIITNCIITGNSAYTVGAGAYYGTLINCVLSGNFTSSFGDGGGAAYSTLINCLLIGNRAGYRGGGAIFCTLINCTVVSNSAVIGLGGGIDSNLAKNCIAYYNSPDNFEYSTCTLSNCCTFPLPASGGNNLTNAPAFVDLANGNYRLQTNSPCINAGINSVITNRTSIDLDGRPRLVDSNVDIGAYEFQGAGMGEFIGWLQQYGLPADGTADYADSDGDGMNNWQEWIAGTIPTNAASVLLLSSPSNSVSGVTVTWQSVNTRTYYLQSSTNLPAFTSIQSNLIGQAGTTSYTDTTVTNSGPYFYRVGVQ